MRVIVGLGNPGAEYNNTVHNSGFMFVDVLHGRIGVGDWRKKFGALVADAEFAGEKLFLMKPQSFMNNSGVPVASMFNFYKMKSEDVFVAHDDIELDFCITKAKKGGGNGGHNGIRSIDKCIGKDYWRLRLGVSRPKNDLDVSDYVLSKFNSEQLGKVNILFDEIIDSFDKLLDNKDAIFTTRLANTKKQDGK